MAFGIYVSDARKGTTYDTGFVDGYLRPDGSLSTDRKAIARFDTIALANEAIERAAFFEGCGVHPGRAAAFVCCID